MRKPAPRVIARALRAITPNQRQAHHKQRPDYVSITPPNTCLSAAEVAGVLAQADADAPVHLVTSIATGEHQPITAALVSEPCDLGPIVFLYLDHAANPPSRTATDHRDHQP
jgi:hypothetical protein